MPTLHELVPTDHLGDFPSPVKRSYRNLGNRPQKPHSGKTTSRTWVKFLHFRSRFSELRRLQRWTILKGDQLQSHNFQGKRRNIKISVKHTMTIV